MNINEFPSSNGMGGQKDKPISTEATKYLSQDPRERKSTNFPNVKDEKENSYGFLFASKTNQREFLLIPSQMLPFLSIRDGSRSIIPGVTIV